MAIIESEQARLSAGERSLPHAGLPLTPSADSAARDYYAREKYRSRLCLGGVSLGLAVLGCCAALLPGFQSAAGTLGIALVCAGLLALLRRRQLRCRGRVDSCLLRMRPLLVQQF